MVRKLPPMVPGGKWIKPSGEAPVTYVAHEAHIKRLFSEGGEPVPDPRKLEDQPEDAPPADPIALQEEIARLHAELAALQTEKSGTDASEKHDGGHHSPRALDDRRSSGSKSTVR